MRIIIVRLYGNLNETQDGQEGNNDYDDDPMMISSLLVRGKSSGDFDPLSVKKHTKKE